MNSFSVPKLGHFHCRTKGSTPRPAVFHTIYNRDVQHLSASRYFEITVLPEAHRPSTLYVTNTMYISAKIVMRECNFEDVRSTRPFITKYLIFHFRIVRSKLWMERLIGSREEININHIKWVVIVTITIELIENANIRSDLFCLIICIFRLANHGLLSVFKRLKLKLK